MTTSHKEKKDFLVIAKPAQFERLLTDWVNLPPASSKKIGPALERLWVRYRNVFAELNIESSDAGPIIHLRDYLRAAWETADPRSRQWYIFKARDQARYYGIEAPYIHQFSAKQAQSSEILILDTNEIMRRNAPPPLTQFEQAMFHLQRRSEYLRRCGNPECPAPYIFVRKKGTKYCSPKCSATMLREQKRQWWTVNRGGDGDGGI
jgi:hypothetical protein